MISAMIAASCLLLSAASAQLSEDAPGVPQIEMEPEEIVAAPIKQGQSSGIGAAGECPAPKKGVKKSDRCRAGLNRSLNVFFEDPELKGKDAVIFGASDQAIIGPFEAEGKKKLTTIVVHNGGFSAKSLRDNWAGKRSGTHYSIDRRGRVFQHVGEEWRTVHAHGANNYSVGIEINLPKEFYKSETCNGIPSAGLDPKKPAHWEIARRLCRPTDEQYGSLRALIEDIAKRNSIPIDEEHVIGHCEAPGSDHGDPRGFDWSQIGLSKAKKAETVASGKTTCSWYEP